MNIKTIIKNSIIDYVPQNNYIYIFGRKWYKRFTNRWTFDILNAYNEYKKNNISFIQIGSNDGIKGDPICNFIKQKQWHGILVEPVPYLFDQLKSNYIGFHHKLIFENSAIAYENGTLKFYRLKKCDLPGLPVWYDQLGSFKKEVVLKHRNLVPYFDELFIEDEVNAITFNDLIKKYSINKLDFLHIDTEGYDYEIINMVLLTNIEIEFIYFEHIHLSNFQYKSIIQNLQQNGYVVRKKNGSDTIALKNYVLSSFATKNI
jgi:FkbM family methyltransferase